MSEKGSRLITSWAGSMSTLMLLALGMWFTGEQPGYRGLVLVGVLVTVAALLDAAVGSAWQAWKKSRSINSARAE